jgi:hypothetical protein
MVCDRLDRILASVEATLRRSSPFNNIEINSPIYKENIAYIYADGMRIIKVNAVNESMSEACSVMYLVIVQILV